MIYGFSTSILSIIDLISNGWIINTFNSLRRQIHDFKLFILTPKGQLSIEQTIENLGRFLFMKSILVGCS